MSRPFQTLARPATFCYEEKRSRFIAYLWPIKSKDEGFVHFEAIKAEHPEARHHCWAYVIGDPEQALAAGFHDAGEPGGTAGKPMLNVLMQRKVGNVFAVVVRYFGGIKLGAGGLTRAYGQAVSRALDEAELCKVVPTQAVNIQVEFALEQRVRNILDQQDISILDAAYTDKVVLLCECPMDFVAQLREILQEQTAGRVTVNSAEAAQ
jgi:uncharacterized YigZ family protein